MILISFNAGLGTALAGVVHPRCPDLLGQPRVWAGGSWGRVGVGWGDHGLPTESALAHAEAP